jgi:hypothetical protein
MQFSVTRLLCRYFNFVLIWYIPFVIQSEAKDPGRNIIFYSELLVNQ